MNPLLTGIKNGKVWYQIAYEFKLGKMPKYPHDFFNDIFF